MTMSCELYKSEMYIWRPGSKATGFAAFFEHMKTCPECALHFAQLTASDQRVRQTMEKLPESHSLEARILAGLAHERMREPIHRPAWKNWMILPIAAVLLFAVALGVGPAIREAQFGREVANILRNPPAAEISSTDQKQLLDWSTKALSDDSGLPPTLSRV
ncbi:MAG: hypothetical protein ABI158_09610, partial [Edaphobacter sp.]